MITVGLIDMGWTLLLIHSTALDIHTVLVAKISIVIANYFTNALKDYVRYAVASFNTRHSQKDSRYQKIGVACAMGNVHRNPF